MTDSVSLSALGLRIVEGLTCPEGGPHVVPSEAVMAAVETEQPTPVACLKCRTTVTLERAH